MWMNMFCKPWRDKQRQQKGLCVLSLSYSLGVYSLQRKKSSYATISWKDTNCTSCLKTPARNVLCIRLFVPLNNPMDSCYWASSHSSDWVYPNTVFILCGITKVFPSSWYIARKTLKGLSHEIDLDNFDKNLRMLALISAAASFWIFRRRLRFLVEIKHLLSGKC